MTTTYNGLAKVHQPRPWRCTDHTAIYCPLHGDCTCATPRHRKRDCPLHGIATLHGTGKAIIR